MRVPFPASLTLLGLITSMIFIEEYKLWRYQILIYSGPLQHLRLKQILFLVLSSQKQFVFFL
jgi:hypothetical protein